MALYTCKFEKEILILNSYSEALRLKEENPNSKISTFCSSEEIHRYLEKKNYNSEIKISIHIEKENDCYYWIINVRNKIFSGDLLLPNEEECMLDALEFIKTKYSSKNYRIVSKDSLFPFAPWRKIEN